MGFFYPSRFVVEMVCKTEEGYERCFGYTGGEWFADAIGKSVRTLWIL